MAAGYYELWVEIHNLDTSRLCDDGGWDVKHGWFESDRVADSLGKGDVSYIHMGGTAGSGIVTATGMAKRILNLLRGLLVMSVGIATVDGTAGIPLMAGLSAFTFTRGDWQPLFNSILYTKYKVPDCFASVLKIQAF